jgi:hypothetical protein
LTRCRSSARKFRIRRISVADGKQVAYFNIGERQEDISIGSPDRPMRRVTDDQPRDRAPMFTGRAADGRSIVFYDQP